MEQPRFGGVALPPLSTPGGEGMSSQFVTHTMEPSKGAPGFSHVDTRQTETDPDVQKLMEVFSQLGISSGIERHKLKHERQRETQSVENEVYCKNLLLKDRKGQAYLVVCGENDIADLHVVKYHLNVQGNLHFASAGSLWTLLHVHPGAVSPLALVQSSGGVRVCLDASLVKKIDRDVTKLYFHPLRAELQVGLTLSQLETFLHHCDIVLELLPSLTRYDARRRYGDLSGGHHYKHKSSQDPTYKTQVKETGMEEIQEVAEDKGSSQHTVDQGEMMDQAESTFIQYSDFFEQLGVNVQIVPAAGNSGAGNYTTLPCQSVYLKDKRGNYFLLICHEGQKVDFSALKMQLKPKKKIMVLDKEELWSLLHLHQYRQHPFALAQLKQPRFLVAISDNLYHKSKAVLTFPHPADPSLRLQITLKHLERFINTTSHDLTTIQMKGNIEKLQAIAATSICSPQNAAYPIKHAQHSEAENEHLIVGERYCQVSEEQEPATLSVPARMGSNLFYHLTTALREWIARYIRRFVQLLERCLPNQILGLLHHSSLWNRMLTSGHRDLEEGNEQSEEHANEMACREEEKLAKIARLKHLIKESGIQVDMTETHPQARFLKDDAERCKTRLLEDRYGRAFIVLCTEDDNPSGRNLRRLRTAFRCHSSLQLVYDGGISHYISWPKGSLLSWTQDDLSPMALMDMDLSSLGRAWVGMTGPLYSFPDTTLSFELPSLGVTLRMSNNDLEKMTEQLGFFAVYLP